MIFYKSEPASPPASPQSALPGLLLLHGTQLCLLKSLSPAFHLVFPYDLRIHSSIHLLNKYLSGSVAQTMCTQL